MLPLPTRRPVIREPRKAQPDTTAEDIEEAHTEAMAAIEELRL
jgi:hypothetical protein